MESESKFLKRLRKEIRNSPFGEGIAHNLGADIFPMISRRVALVSKTRPDRFEEVVEGFDAVKCTDCGRVFKNKK